MGIHDAGLARLPHLWAVLRNSLKDTALRAVIVATLLWVGSLALATAVAGEGHLSVVYEPPRLSVEARGVSLAELLRVIGTKVGFAVVDHPGLLHPGLTVSIQDATLDMVLRQLLRGESHVVVYQDQGEARIDKIVLLDPPTSAWAGPDLPPSPFHESPGPEQLMAPSSTEREGPRSWKVTAGTHSLPDGSPDPAAIQQEILDSVLTQVDATRRATLDFSTNKRSP